MWKNSVVLHAYLNGGSNRGRPMRQKVLLVEDDRDFGGELQDYLSRYGFEVERADTTQALSTVLSNCRPDAIILDQFLHGDDALPEIPRIRSTFAGQILVLTGNNYEGDRVVALESGADDCLLKGIGFREVVARLRAVGRRTAKAEAVGAGIPQEDSDYGWTVHPGRRQVLTPSGTPVSLTGLEFETFHQLYSARGRIVSRDELALHVLRRPAATAGRSVENLLSRVRMKFLPQIPDATFIKAIRGKGYVFLGFR